MAMASFGVKSQIHFLCSCPCNSRSNLRCPGKSSSDKQNEILLSRFYTCTHENSFAYNPNHTKERKKKNAFALTVVAGRKNSPGSSISQRRKSWQPNSENYGRQKPPNADRFDSIQDLNNSFEKIELREDQAIGQVVTAQANFLRIIVTCCEKTVQVNSDSSGFKITDFENGIGKCPSNTLAGKSEESDTMDSKLDPSPSASFLPSPSHFSSFATSIPSPSPSPPNQKVGTELLCYVRAVLKKIKRKVLVGDVVVVGGIDWTDRRGMVERILPRQSELSEPPISNVDHLVLLFSFHKPDLEPLNLSRFLIAAEASNLPFTLALNKSDLVDEQVINEWKARLRAWGYTPHMCSIETKKGIMSLGKIMNNRVSVIVGPSGVGKSSLIKSLRGILTRNSTKSLQPLTRVCEKSTDCMDADLEAGEHEHDVKNDARYDPSANAEWRVLGEGEGEEGVGGEEERGAGLKRYGMMRSLFAEISIGEVSERSGRGRHTTRHVSLLKLPHGGYLADTPGFSQPSLNSLSIGNLPRCFPEITKRIEASKDEMCAFKNCVHVSEPNCVVGSDWERFSHYVQLLEEIKCREENEKKNPNQNDSFKVKTKAMGVKHGEPMLETKRHRRESRRSAHQSLLDLIEEDEEEEEVNGKEGLVD